MISSTVGLVFVPATSGEDAFPLDHVRFSHGLSLADPSVDEKMVCPFQWILQSPMRGETHHSQMRLGPVQ